jgi:hypothetical protein
MNSALLNLKHDPLPYLFNPRQQAWVKYQTLVRILGRPADDSEVIYWQKKRDISAVVRRIREKQMPDGSFPCMPWMHIHEYYFHRLLEMGYGMEDESVRRTADKLLNYQLPDGGYMHPTGRRVNIPDPNIGWAPCMTGYVIKALINLGLEKHPKLIKSLEMMKYRQTFDGGWNCRESPCVDECNCIICGTPWAAVCLSQAQMISNKDNIGKKAIGLFSRYKKEIIKHGYMNDRCFRCDESLVVPSLISMGLSKQHPLIKDLWESLIKKQQSDGSWLFRGKSSPWYTIEVLVALNYVDRV